MQSTLRNNLLRKLGNKSLELEVIKHLYFGSHEWQMFNRKLNLHFKNISGKQICIDVKANYQRLFRILIG